MKKQKIGFSLMIIGLILVLLALSLFIYNNYENYLAKKRSAEIANSLATLLEPEEILDPFDTDMKVVEIDGYGYIGYLSIPALDLDLPIMDQWDYKRLKIAPCRYYGSAKTDNLVIAAHNYKSHFGYIGKLAIGSNVILTDMDGVRHTYAVAAIETLQPTDVDRVKDTGDDLILYTCTYNGRARIALRCTRIK